MEGRGNICICKDDFSVCTNINAMYIDLFSLAFFCCVCVCVSVSVCVGKGRAAEIQNKGQNKKILFFFCNYYYLLLMYVRAKSSFSTSRKHFEQIRRNHEPITKGKWPNTASKPRRNAEPVDKCQRLLRRAVLVPAHQKFLQPFFFIQKRKQNYHSISKERYI